MQELIRVNMTNLAKVGYLLATLVVAACGGGAGVGTSEPKTEAAQTLAPTVMVSVSTPKAFVGTPVTVNWSSTNAMSCTGLEALSGSLPVSGQQSFTPIAGGIAKFSVSCAGPGGMQVHTATLVVPVPVQLTSYLNAKETGVGSQTMPRSASFRSDEHITAGHQYADFFQEGAHSMVAVTNVFAGLNGYASAVPGQVYFFRRNASGAWEDKTSDLVADSNRTGCLSPRKVIVADFNADKRPDVFIACTGLEGATPPGWTGPIGGESSRVLLSQPDGTYKNTTIGTICYCHGAAAADFAGDGYADILVTDVIPDSKPYFLINNRDGTFTKDTTRLSAEIDGYSFAGQTTRYALAIYTAELVDFDSDGKIDVFLAGEESTELWHWAPSIYRNDGSNHFLGSGTKLPSDGIFNITLDAVFSTSKIALLRVTRHYERMGVEVLSRSTLQRIGFQEVSAMDTTWITRMGRSIVSAFAINTFSVDFE